MTEETNKAKGVASRMATSRRRAQKKAAAAGTPKELSMADLQGFSPFLVGIVRGCIHAAVMGILTYLTTRVSATAGGAGLVGGVATVGVATFRSVEGLLDKLLLGAPPQAKLLGGKDVGTP